MDKKRYSINYGKRGKDYFPGNGVVGFSDDGMSFTLKLGMKPDHEYEFIVSGNGFKSVEGYPLKPFEVRFKTR